MLDCKIPVKEIINYSPDQLAKLPKSDLMTLQRLGLITVPTTSMFSWTIGECLALKAYKLEGITPEEVLLVFTVHDKIPFTH